MNCAYDLSQWMTEVYHRFGCREFMASDLPTSLNSSGMFRRAHYRGYIEKVGAACDTRRIWKICKHNMSRWS